ncbi:MAG TPA: SRPBCC family protein [Caulobacteraceae bacterium]|jgi:uncharacterized protein YndB with AHSA1/START domain|nr:SRPBCC family protein [Caulobacteraceae bacterium]
MTIAPVIRTVAVKASPERAFEAFTAQMSQWWPKDHTIAAKPFEAVVMEPHVGGRWFERDADGTETQWGKVLAWDPPGRVLLAWQIGANWAYDPDLITEVEMTFADQGDGTTLVTLEHGKLERVGANAQALADQLGNGWPGLLQMFADYAAA